MAEGKVPDRRLTRETKDAKKSTEFILTVAVILLILIAARTIKATGKMPDQFTASDAWLYVAIVTGAYSIGRGLAKSGVREYPDNGADDGGND